jgi:GxxExxY protein
MEDYPESDLTDKIIAAAIEVQSELGCAFSEPVYQTALAHEFTLRAIPYKRENSIKVQYQGMVAGNFRLDFLVDSRVIVELKAVDKLSEIHTAQVICYLAATGKKVGLLLNFARPSLKDGGIKRVVL